MSNIQILPENLANKIAAGEVVERPASIVKELIENAIDAKAKRIIITLLEGGIRKIQVQDDGEGMTRENALLAFLRHATSKIVTEEDLASITTLGFRGEALPSIASISKIGLVTKTAKDEAGTEIILEGGIVKETRDCGAPVGSTFEVSEIFYNTPARKKFLKSSGTELSHVSHVVYQHALAHPEIAFQLIHQERTLLSVPVVSRQSDRLSALYGEEALNQCMEIHRSLPDGSMGIDLFISKPPLPRVHRKEQIIFLNGRPVKSPLVSRAILDAFGSLLMKGETPFYVLYLSIDPSVVDVNVHPTKKEVRFQNADAVYSFIKGGAGAPTGGNERTGHVVAGRPSGVVSQNKGQPSSGNVGHLLTDTDRGGDRISGWPAFVRDGEKRPDSQKSSSLFTNDIEWSTGENVAGSFAARGGRAIGQVYGTFLLAEVDGEFVILDQHTAHERILYESFLKQWNHKAAITIQPLLIPRQIDMTLAQAARIAENLPLFKEIGFTIEPFGETTFLIREVPAAFSDMNVESFLIDFSDDIAELNVETAPPSDRPKHTIIASMACHAAVRANQILSLDKIETLLYDYYSRNTPPTCPHGRPVVLKYHLPEMEKLFRRR